MLGRTVLLVEDSVDDEVLILRAFKKHNQRDQMVVVRDGQEALDYLLGTGTYAGRGTVALPAVVFLDLKMPKIGGLEVLRRLRGNRLTRLMPVVILSSSNEERDLLDGYSLGANGYVRKPIDYRELTEAIRQLSQYWLSLNEPPPAGR